MRRRAKGSLYLAVAAVLVAACATEPKPKPASIDPSNPSAPESAPLSTDTLSHTAAGPSGMKPADTPAPPASSSDHGHEHDGAAPATTLYTCPMHPEVISDKPGKCPKCGMTLVPKKPDEGKP
jgi:hypothetical protein